MIPQMSDNDALRSLRYYFWKHLADLDPDYDVRLAIEDDAWERPSAIVQTAGPAQLANSSRRVATVVRPFAIYIYPEKGSTAKEAQLRAGQVEQQVRQAFLIGGHRGHPARVPIWDWSNKDPDESLLEVVPPDNPDDEPTYLEPDPAAYMWVSDCSVDRRADPDDEQLQTVICNIRLNWRGAGQLPVASPVVDAIGFEGEMS